MGYNTDKKENKERQIFLDRFWRYYRTLEDDCIYLRRFIDFRGTNMTTCSDEIIKQLLSVCSEFDGLCKKITGKYSTNKKQVGICDFRKWFLDNDDTKDIAKMEVFVLGSDIRLKPFLQWGHQNQKLPWWDAYNKIKHCREKNYSYGTLKNLLSALAALSLLECYQYERASFENQEEKQQIFRVAPSTHKLFYIPGFLPIVDI